MNIAPLENKNNLEQINDYFDELDNIREDENEKNKNIRKCLILKVNNLLSEEVSLMIKRMDDLSQTHYMPLVLLLVTEEIIKDSDKKLNIDF